MPKFNFHQNSFRAGELSEKVYGRTDLDIYRVGNKRQKNFINYPQGGMYRRPGTVFVTDKVAFKAPTNGTTQTYTVDNFSEDSRLVPVTLSNGKRYIVVFDKRSYGTATAIDVDTWQQSFVPNYGSDDGLGFIYFNGYDTADDLDEVQFAAKNDITMMVHQNQPPFYVRAGASGARLWPLSIWDQRKKPATNLGRGGALEAGIAWDYYLWLPYRNINTTGVTLAASAAAQFDPCTLTASASIFTPAHVGNIYALNHSGTVGAVLVFTYTNGSTMDGVVLDALSGTGTTAAWFEGAWSNLRGWPRTVSFFNGRSVFGGTISEPDKVWFSETFDIFQMSDSGEDIALTVAKDATSPFNVTPDTERAVDIKWLSPGSKSMAVGGAEREFIIYGVEESPFGDTNYQVSPETSYGSKAVQAIRVDERPIFVAADGKAVRDLFFNRDQNQYLSTELSFQAEHFLRKSPEITGAEEADPAIRQMSFQKDPNSTVWFIDDNNKLFAMTRDTINNALAFHDHQLGGTSSADADVAPEVLSMASIKAADGEHDQTWMLVKRNVSGSTLISLEYIGKEYEKSTLAPTFSEIDDLPVCMDSAILFSYSSPAFYAALTSSATADKAGGSTTGTATGSPTFGANGAALTGGTGKYISYDGTSNVDTAQVGAIRFEFMIDETDITPAGEFTLFSISQAAGSTNNLIRLDLDISSGGTPQFKVTINDSTGSAIINDVTLGAVAFFGQQNIFSNRHVEIELNYDLTTGATRLFVDGTQTVDVNGAAITIASTGTRTTAIDLLRIGSDPSATNNADGYIRNFQFFSTVQHTENYKPKGVYYGLQTITSEKLSIFEDEEVVVVADGNYLGEYTVNSGALNLGTGNTDFDWVMVGYGYNAFFETMDLEDGAAIGSSQGAVKRIDQAAMRFSRSVQGFYGPSEDSTKLHEITFRDTDLPSTDPIGIFKGVKTSEFKGDYGQPDGERRVSFYFEAPYPLICSITSVTLKGQTYD